MAALAVGLWSVAGPPRDVKAQESDLLAQAEALADEGVAGQARQLLARWEDEHGASAPLDERARAWYLAARLAEEGETAELLYLRVIVEGSSTPYADDALLRLGQYKFAQGEHGKAIEYLGRLRRDYPTSEHGPTALLWIARSARLAGDDARACAAAEQGLNELVPATDPDLEIALLEQRRGCHDVTGAYTVQVAAFRDDAAAQNLARELLTLGFDAWVLNATADDPIYRVRVGRRLIEGEAKALVERLTRMGYSPFIVQGTRTTGG
ncbi:MAG: tetratricopeptide repeat protein [Gemmatimonadetes bacterium]|uniref:Tetratricopeptide repeat protein n=1 Tax=Candidatus Kutchimonas denitrificans TaxID=3056748 RepID=A0AAE4ZCU1_9BACT|nr:tetratricopeptide repeat protein [Gemmatimonadota bacterium]NIR75505.1 tetratricopeptide repeat protein [Candidatus Kutchimonas denitrificans]NIS01819.1 tetratricopeptide repeat protein [Gemmatimonadota bacterium]NIT67600.1 tetratricopeptide repeat protein [Gemmatimonadota bacterium]NIU53474.1 tetratricopeptide repeat protein [Gemmatimonadota bacterium]